MSAPLKTFEVTVQGLWTRTHIISGPKGELGRLTVHRNKWGLVDRARYSPKKGEVLEMRRDPGLLRGQFSFWTDGNEWLGSSLRWSFSKRGITLHTGSRPLKLQPSPTLAAGWVLMAPKTGRMATIRHKSLFSRKATLEVHRRLEFELLLFAYFLGSMVRLESIWPGPILDEPIPSASGATCS